MSLLTRVLGALEDQGQCDRLSTAQRNFLRLHVKRDVEMWKWHFCKTQLRAHAGRRHATIWVDELDDLIARGLMVRGAGEADTYATMTGKALIG